MTARTNPASCVVRGCPETPETGTIICATHAAAITPPQQAPPRAGRPGGDAA